MKNEKIIENEDIYEDDVNVFDEVEVKAEEPVIVEETKKPGFFRRAGNWIVQHRSTIAKVAAGVAIGVAGYVLGAKVSQRDNEEIGYDDDDTGYLPYNSDDDDDGYSSDDCNNEEEDEAV